MEIVIEKWVNNDLFPVHYRRLEDCCGCYGCFAICPTGAIEMQADSEGFDYPLLEISRCIKCYQCLKACPIKVKIFNTIGSFSDSHVNSDDSKKRHTTL